MSGLDRLNLRVAYLGSGALGRLKEGKLNSFKSALTNSYHSNTIKHFTTGEVFPALISPDKLNPDYDNKIISVGFESNLKAGESFIWTENNTYWIITLQELTEKAYFRGDIRRCLYVLEVNGTSYPVYIQGPTETEIRWRQKKEIVYNELNKSLFMYIKKDPNTLEYFHRFKTIILNGNTWRVTSFDAISMEGVLQVNLEEYFNNPSAALQEFPVIEPLDQTQPHIAGPLFVKPYDIKTYEAKNAFEDGSWQIVGNKAKIKETNGPLVIVEITTGKSGSFELYYTKEEETPIVSKITIESF